MKTLLHLPTATGNWTIPLNRYHTITFHPLWTFFPTGIPCTNSSLRKSFLSWVTDQPFLVHMYTAFRFSWLNNLRVHSYLPPSRSKARTWDRMPSTGPASCCTINSNTAQARDVPTGEDDILDSHSSGYIPDKFDARPHLTTYLSWFSGWA